MHDRGYVFILSQSTDILKDYISLISKEWQKLLFYLHFFKYHQTESFCMMFITFRTSSFWQTWSICLGLSLNIFFLQIWTMNFTNMNNISLFTFSSSTYWVNESFCSYSELYQGFPNFLSVEKHTGMFFSSRCEIINIMILILTFNPY